MVDARCIIDENFATNVRLSPTSVAFTPRLVLPAREKQCKGGGGGGEMLALGGFQEYLQETSFRE